METLIQGKDSRRSEEAPLYRRIQDELKKRIADGTWSVGDALPNRNALSEEFSTTRVTVDKAIQQLIDEGVLTSLKGSGTYVAQAKNGAHGQRGTKPKRQALHIAVVFGKYAPCLDDYGTESDMDQVYFGPVYRGISEGLAGKPVEVSYVRLVGSEYLDYVRNNDVDGLILATPAVEDFPVLRDLLDECVTFVAIGISSNSPENAVLPCVDAANRDGAAAAAQHLLSLGHSRIACVNLAMGLANHEDRMEGFIQALADAGAPMDPDLLLQEDNNYDWANFDRNVDEWLTGLEQAAKLPTAIFCVDFAMTMSALAALRRHNLPIPQAVSLMGFDDPLMMAHLTPSITTVRQPVYGIGMRASQRLMEALYSPGGPRRVVGTELLRTQVMARESTAAPRAAD